MYHVKEKKFIVVADATGTNVYEASDEIILTVEITQQAKPRDCDMPV